MKLTIQILIKYLKLISYLKYRGLSNAKKTNLKTIKLKTKSNLLINHKIFSLLFFLFKVKTI